jgi:hypothetical protein
LSDRKLIHAWYLNHEGTSAPSRNRRRKEPSPLLGSTVLLIPPHQLFHEVHLDLLDLEKFLPLVFEQDVEFLMQVADFQFGF